MKSFLKSIFLVSVLLSTTTACNDYLDINTDPNNPTTADINLVLPSGQAFVSFIVGGQFNILGGTLGQYWTPPKGGNQYRQWDQYTINSSTFDGNGGQFVNLYAGAMQDFQDVITKGTAQNEWRMVGVAKIMKAYTFHILTDLYGDIPFTEALSADKTVTPRYDKQKDVYTAIQALLDEGKADIAKKQGRFPGQADLIYKAASDADMDKWTRVANTLKLRCYVRLSQVDAAGAKAGVQALYSGQNEFIRATESFSFANSANTNAENPFWQAVFRLPNNMTAGKTIGDIMTPLADPRMPVYFLDADLSTPAMDYVFVANGTTSGNTPSNTSYPGKWFIGQQFTNGSIRGTDAASGVTTSDNNAARSRPTLFLTYEESLFLRAEAAERGWAPATEVAKSLYEDAIKASMSRYGVTIGDYLTKVDYTKATNKIQAIITQKYVALFGTGGLEAFAEYRRTGFPAMPVPTTNSTGGRYLKRLPYVDSELQRNPNVSQTGIAPGDILTPVWWDVD